MRSNVLKLLPFPLVLAAGLLFPFYGEAGSIDQQRAEELIYLVKQDCGSCHGMTMKGGLGPSLLPEQLDGRDPVSLSEIIINGVPGTPMPPWQGLLSTEEAVWIAEQLQEGLKP